MWLNNLRLLESTGFSFFDCNFYKIYKKVSLQQQYSKAMLQKNATYIYSQITKIIAYILEMHSLLSNKTHWIAWFLNWPVFPHDFSTINHSNCLKISAALLPCIAEPFNPELLALPPTESVLLLPPRNFIWLSSPFFSFFGNYIPELLFPGYCGYLGLQHSFQ